MNKPDTHLFILLYKKVAPLTPPNIKDTIIEVATSAQQNLPMDLFFY